MLCFLFLRAALQTQKNVNSFLVFYRLQKSDYFIAAYKKSIMGPSVCPHVGPLQPLNRSGPNSV